MGENNKKKEKRSGRRGKISLEMERDKRRKEDNKEGGTRDKGSGVWGGAEDRGVNRKQSKKRKNRKRKWKEVKDAGEDEVD